MKSWLIHHYGDPNVVLLEEVPVPEPAAGQVLVRVEAAGVNPLDNKLISGAVKSMFPLEFPYALGGDLAGTVERVGPGVTQWKAGERVFGHVAGGAFSEHAVVPTTTLARLPDALSFADAAALPTAAGTAWEALMERAALQHGQTVLVNAASGGVGHFAVQFAKLAGARVIATASAAHLHLVRELGADEAIDYKATDIRKQVHGVDAALDPFGGETLQRSLAVLRDGGVLVSLAGPPDAATDQAARKRGLRIVPLRHQPLGGRLEHIAGLAADGRLRVVTDAAFAFAGVPDALARVASGHVKGKVVVKVR